MRDELRAILTPTKKRRIAKRLYELALAGDVKAIALIYDNHDGKAMQAHEVTGPEGGAISLRWESHADPDDPGAAAPQEPA